MGNGAWIVKKAWLARLGVAGFCFFLVKGLVWIGAGLLVFEGCRR